MLDVPVVMEESVIYPTLFVKFSTLYALEARFPGDGLPDVAAQLIEGLG
jgi:hypothetical protein